MSGRYLLDTNIIIALFNGDPSIKTRLETAAEVFIPSVALGELHFGAAHSSRPEANADRIDDFATNSVVLQIDAETARHYGRLKGALRKKGQPIPENDIWIAACAIQHGLVLVTRDSHFQNLEGLDVQSW